MGGGDGIASIIWIVVILAIFGGWGNGGFGWGGNNGNLNAALTRGELCHVYIFSYDIYMDVEDEEHLAQFISDYGKFIISDTNELLYHMLNYTH